jgi:NADP-dependent 3-hydroxy acid dehydrogenase YdfG
VYCIAEYRKEHIMREDLENKVVILTGAGGGIGSAIAEKLAERKMKIVLFGGNNIEKLEKTKEKIQSYSSSLMLPGNLTDPDFMTSAIETVLSEYLLTLAI